MRQIGITHTGVDLPAGSPISALQEKSVRLGVDGVLLMDLPAYFEAGGAAERGVGALAAGIGAFSPLRKDRNPTLARMGNGDVTDGLRRILPLAAELGLTELFFVVGMIEDRAGINPSWTEQLQSVAQAIQSLELSLKDAGIRLLVKTHEEITSREILDLIAEVGPEHLGVAFDPVNVYCRMEDPVLVAQRLKPHVNQIHVDDAVVCLESDGIRRWLVPMGQGDLDWASIFELFAETPAWIELHKGQFVWPAFDSDWLKGEPGLELTDYVSVARYAVARGNLSEPPCDQSDPLARLPQMLAALGREPVASRSAM